MLKGAIFDMDGVLVDNIRHHMVAWRELGSELGREFAEEDIKRLFGKRNREILKGLLGSEPGEEELLRYGRRKEEIYRSVMAPELRPVPGLLSFLNELKQAGVKAAVATSGPKENVDFVLDGLKIRSAFEALVTGLEAPRSKPDPGIFLLAAERLGVDPQDCVVLEDSPPGIKAALAAGCICVAVATTHSDAELQQYQPDRIIKDFTGLTVEELAGS